MENLSGKFSGLVFPRFQAPPQNIHAQLVGIPLHFHFLDPKCFSRRFSAYGGDHHLRFLGVLSEGAITRVSRNLTFVQIEKGPPLEVFYLFSCV